uniref:Uncharacterized protein n=1 Tax=Rhizophora mucronata TaxID=61149 RepID=A0A2P2PM99_RHIMU
MSLIIYKLVLMEFHCIMNKIYTFFRFQKQSMGWRCMCFIICPISCMLGSLTCMAE